MEGSIRGETASSTRLDEEPRSSRIPDSTWARHFARRLAVTDLLIVAWAVLGAQVARFGLPDAFFVDEAFLAGDLTLSYTTVSVALIALWSASLAIADTRSSRLVGVGTTEYRRVIHSSVTLFGLVAIAALLLRVDLARSYILLAFPLGVLGLLVGRWMWRRWLMAQRAQGSHVSRAVLVGSLASVVAIATELSRSTSAGYLVVGTCIPGWEGGDVPRLGVPNIGGLEELPDLIRPLGADTVIVTSGDDLHPSRIRRLSWALEPGRQHLVVAPSLTDIAGPRIHFRPVAGLPLVHIETPRYDGAKAFLKRAFDIVASAALLLVSAPLLAVLALVIRLSSDGPVLYRSERIGYRGKPFRMLKFRSMRVGAEHELADLLGQQGTAGTPLFKISNDPRVTPIGRVIRKYSLDELPQLFNVLVGQMSIVGPRPQVAAEVALYDADAARRLLLKPGMSGLWQVSGRSSLSWEDSIRLDLYYVENWSLTADLVILWRTFRAVVVPAGTAH